MAIVRVVVQARTSSTRLPGKALLPVAGYPAALLATLRASHNNWDTVLATSNNPSDDRLAKMACSLGLKVARGPLQDVLTRFILATDNLPGDAIIVRLTADNLFPDRTLLDEVIKEFVREKCEFLFTWSPNLDVPYGLSVELFRVAALRDAHEYVKNPSDREHVTPWIGRTYGTTIYRPRGLPDGYGRLRCTIDTFDDYMRIESLFHDVDDPVRIPWRTLCSRLAEHPATPPFVVPQRKKNGHLHSTLVLGTAQLGGCYGVTNNEGPPSLEVASSIVRTALHHGVTHLDTARAYGMSERYIGSALAGRTVAEGQMSHTDWIGGSPLAAHVVTKLIPLDEVSEDIPQKYLVNLVDHSVFRSCRELGLYTLPTLLVHRAIDRIRFSGVIWKRLIELKDQGVILNLGVSASTPQETLDALEDPDVSHIQIPFNILDWRWKEAEVDVAINQRPDVTVHARSALLQGLLVTQDATAWPRLPNVTPDEILMQLNQWAKEIQRKNVLDLALSYVRSHPWIDGVIIGIESIKQLIETAHLFTSPTLLSGEIGWIDSRRNIYPEHLLDPSRWRG